MQKGRTVHSCTLQGETQKQNNDSSSYYTIFKFNNNIRNINYLSIINTHKRCRRIDDDDSTKR